MGTQTMGQGANRGHHVGICGVDDLAGAKGEGALQSCRADVKRNDARAQRCGKLGG